MVCVASRFRCLHHAPIRHSIPLTSSLQSTAVLFAKFKHDHHAASTSYWAIGSSVPLTRCVTALEGGGWSFSQYQQSLVSRSSVWFHMAELRRCVSSTARPRAWSLDILNAASERWQKRCLNDCFSNRLIDPAEIMHYGLIKPLPQEFYWHKMAKILALNHVLRRFVWHLACMYGEFWTH